MFAENKTPVLIIEEKGMLVHCQGPLLMYFTKEELDYLVSLLGKTVYFYKRNKLSNLDIARMNKENLDNLFKRIENNSLEESSQKSETPRHKYFFLMYDRESHKLKIASSFDHYKRFEVFQKSNVNKLEMIASMTDYGAENLYMSDLHKMFNIDYKWFPYNQEVVDFFKTHSKVYDI